MNKSQKSKRITAFGFHKEKQYFVSYVDMINCIPISFPNTQPPSNIPTHLQCA